MPIDLDTLAGILADNIDELPTEAVFRGRDITIRIGEAPKTRELIIAGMEIGQSCEALVKREDADPEPVNGESLTIAGVAHKIASVSPLLSLSAPAGYRLKITRTS
jgi:hypothetical protein